jgi:rhodanese-related sulfurtransferase
MSLAIQILRICTVSLGLGLILLSIRGVPQAQQAGVSGVCSAPEAFSLLPRWIEPTDARALIGDPGAVFLDCRSRQEYQAGHIASALSIPSDQESIPDPILRLLEAARVIVTYCDAHSGCESSHRLAARLGELGYDDVRILKDGMPGWLQRGFPAESGACHMCGEASL